MAKHTPGPWVLNGGYHPAYASISISAGKRGICAIASSIKRPGEESMANARLITAAPEMLELLAEYLAFNGDYASSMPEDAWVEKVRAVVAKAT